MRIDWGLDVFLLGKNQDVERLWDQEGEAEFGYIEYDLDLGSRRLGGSDSEARRCQFKTMGSRKRIPSQQVLRSMGYRTSETIVDYRTKSSRRQREVPFPFQSRVKMDGKGEPAMEERQCAAVPFLLSLSINVAAPMTKEKDDLRVMSDVETMCAEYLRKVGLLLASHDDDRHPSLCLPKIPVDASIACG